MRIRPRGFFKRQLIGGAHRAAINKLQREVGKPERRHETADAAAFLIVHFGCALLLFPVSPAVLCIQWISQ